MPTLAFTHFQPLSRQLSVRAALWLNELTMDLDDVNYIISQLKLWLQRYTTGTQASFLELFDGNHEKCKEADKRIAGRWDLKPASLFQDRHIPVSWIPVLNVLSGIAQSAHKFSNDISSSSASEGN